MGREFAAEVNEGLSSSEDEEDESDEEYPPAMFESFVLGGLLFSKFLAADAARTCILPRLGDTPLWLMLSLPVADVAALCNPCPGAAAGKYSFPLPPV